MPPPVFVPLHPPCPFPLPTEHSIGGGLLIPSSHRGYFRGVQRLLGAPPFHQGHPIWLCFAQGLLPMGQRCAQTGCGAGPFFLSVVPRAGASVQMTRSQHPAAFTVIPLRCWRLASVPLPTHLCLRASWRFCKIHLLLGGHPLLSHEPGPLWAPEEDRV